MSVLLFSEVWFLEDFTEFVCAALIFATPIVWMILDYLRRVKKNNQQTQIILTAIEKNAGAVPEELVQSLNKPRKSIKDRLLDKLLWGIICIIAGVGAVVLTVLHYCTVGSMDDNGVMLGIGIAMLAVGVALLIVAVLIVVGEWKRRRTFVFWDAALMTLTGLAGCVLL